MPGVKKALSLISEGSARKNRGRIEARLAAPKPRGPLGYASKWLNARERRIWRELVKCAPAELGESDRPLLEIAVTLKARLEAHTIENSQIPQLISALGKLGMIPSDRRPAAEKKEPDEWNEFQSTAGD